ncbi:helix-turn-helix domain-containing protein [Porphyromonas gingivalis]|uniref:helix-turn-helix domain-containing protein n=1 Tax=Porphyromonas gingivalis TaxID=837 RepID=UPI000C19D99A|nr:helix-turn-helix transcriptional regulator [Porphyromonas gingivalis]ATS03626.1 transcriptional regulator [Porphyromonas gingivalis]
MDNILTLIDCNPQSAAMQVASRVKARRLEMNLTQEGIALRAGMKLPTYRRFERTGEISFRGLLQIGFALNALQDFALLFAQRQYQILDEVLAEQQPKRKRGSKK